MEDLSLYPIKFCPVYKKKIWGGNKLKNVLNKKNAPENAGESWEISPLQNDISLVANGFLKGNNLQEIIEIYMGDLVGPDVYDKYGNEFPLLVKFIDANDYLSVQVHPDNETAQKRHNAYGKTEMWYIIEAENESKLISGFKNDITQQEFVARMNEREITDVLNFVDVKNDDVYFIPAGRIHATGKGILFAEIQQASDITYRVYDWDRKDSNGKERELHTDLAMDVIDYSKVEKASVDYKKELNKPIRIVSSDYFVTNILNINEPIIKSYADCKSFVILMCIDGDFKLEWKDNSMTVAKGETLLVPYELMEVSFYPNKETKILECFIEI